MDSEICLEMLRACATNTASGEHMRCFYLDHTTGYSSMLQKTPPLFAGDGGALSWLRGSEGAGGIDRASPSSRDSARSSADSPASVMSHAYNRVMPVPRRQHRVILKRLDSLGAWIWQTCLVLMS